MSRKNGRNTDGTFSKGNAGKPKGNQGNSLLINMGGVSK